MYHNAPSGYDASERFPVDPDPCALLVFRRSHFLAYLRRRVGSVDAAEDVFQDFAVKVLRAARDARPLGSTEAWIFRVLRNTLFDHYRRRDARRRAETEYATHSRLLESPPESEEITSQTDEDALQALETALSSIRPDQAKVIRALYLRGVQREVLAREMDLEIGTLNVRAFRARRALREVLEGLSRSEGTDAVPCAFGGQPEDRSTVGTAGANTFWAAR